MIGAPEGMSAQASLFDGDGIVLSDGSVCTVEPRGHRTSLICRYVDGECVWGQTFSSDEHEAQVDRVVAAIADDPAAYRRWWA